MHQLACFALRWPDLVDLRFGWLDGDEDKRQTFDLQSVNQKRCDGQKWQNG